MFVLIAVAIAADRTFESDTPVAKTNEAVGVRMSAKSSAWYCPITTALRADAGAGWVYIVNLGGSPITGTASFFPTVSVTDQGVAPVPPVERPFSVEPHGRLALRPADLVDSPFAATLVRLDSGAGAVEHSLGNPVPTVAPSTMPSKQWFTADGATGPNTGLRLGLFNPFPEDAIADLKFMTNEGSTSPADLQGIVIPGRSLLVADITEQVRRRDWVASSVAVELCVVVEQLADGHHQRCAWFFSHLRRAGYFGCVVLPGFCGRRPDYRPHRLDKPERFRGGCVSADAASRW